MTVVSHTDAAAFRAAVGDLFTADPIRHTGAVGLLAGDLHRDTTFLTVHDGDRVAGALLLPGHGGAVTSGLPVATHDEVIDHLVLHGIALGSVRGPTDVTTPFAERWCDRTGAVVIGSVPERLFRLGGLVPPTAPGRSRVATGDDLDLLVRWTDAFAAEALPPGAPPNPASAASVRRDVAAGRAHLLWLDDDAPVSFAKVFSPIVGMSRIGPVYTPPELRGHGYASGATAAAARWALDRGARDVLLFADVDNRVANSVYARLGFTPVLDSVETILARPNTLRG